MLVQALGSLCSGFSATAHQNDHAVGIWRADVIEEVVLPPGQASEFVHRILDDVRAGLIEGIGNLASLEVDIRVLRSTADDRVIWRKGTRPMGVNQFFVD